MTRRQFFQYTLAYWVSFGLAKLLRRELPKSEHFEDEPGIDENGIVIRPPNRK
jgi:hypothetical protein